jgi:hypothetical protein
MDKGDRQNGRPEQVANHRDPLPVPGKATRTSRLEPGREPPVQRKPAPPVAPGEPATGANEPTETTNEETSMTGTGGAVSPGGDQHPGEIVHEDKIDGRTWTKAASEVPITIAWVEVDKVWEPVVRIEITGTAEQRRITKFGKDGKMLESTIQQHRPGPGGRPAPAPQPDAPSRRPSRRRASSREVTRDRCRRARRRSRSTADDCCASADRRDS